MNEEPPQGHPPGISRREMLTLLGASLSLAGFAACRRPVEKIVPFAGSPEEVVPGVPRHYATTMPFGRSAYGLLVETHGGHPTKIEGNPLHPSTSGASSALMQASILDLYDPDRSSAVRLENAPSDWKEFVSFWSELHAGYAQNFGSGLAVLSESHTSPTLARLREQLQQTYPEILWVTYEPVSPQNVHRGLESATGTAWEPRHAFEAAKTVLSLDSDFLLMDPENVAHARAFAEARRVRRETDPMNRLYVVESGFSVTGAMADHRLPLRSRALGSWLYSLTKKLASFGLSVEAPAAPDLEEFDDRWLESVARDLLDQRGNSLIVAGWNQPPQVHELVFALNAALGNVGRTVSYYTIDDADRPDRNALKSLTGAMREGEVETIVILGGNPVYNAPVDLEFEQALARVGHAVHLSSHFDETSRRCEWHLPRAHFLEAWGDCRPAGGPSSVTQPVVQPLLGGRSAVELLALLESCEERSGYDEVRATWRAILGDAGFETKWNRVLHDGLLSGSDEPGAAPRRIERALPSPPGTDPEADALEVVFRPSEAVHDGRFANVAWLQELPEPLTKMTWDNPALLSPRTMESLGLRNEDVVRVRLEGRVLELPVWSRPGQADGSMALTLGYGRTSAGRVGDGVGFNAYGLRSLRTFESATGVRLEKTGRTHPLASTQEHSAMQGRPIVREAVLEQYRRHPNFARESAAARPLKQLFADQPYDEGYQWGMSIDLNTCTGCNACVIACQSENNIPIVGKEQVRKSREMHWIRLDRYFVNEDDPRPGAAAGARFQPVPCMHCENAPCEQVCPVAATMHDSEGLNAMVYNRCIGTRYCSNNCPYKVRRFNYYNFTGDLPEIMKLAQNPDVTVRSRGVIEKCTYCVQRINAAKIKSRLDGRTVADGEIRTACEQACPSGAIVFGNIRDASSRVSGRRGENRTYVLLEELNDRPRTTYQAKLRNPNPELEGS